MILLRRWVVERSFAWIVRVRWRHFRRLAPDFKRTPQVLRSPYFLAFAILMLQAFGKSIAQVL